MARKKEKGKDKGAEQRTRGISEQALLDIAVPEDLYKRAVKEVKGMECVTPYMLSQKLGVSVSTSRKILSRMREEGLVKLYSPGRRSPIYVPA